MQKRQEYTGRRRECTDSGIYRGRQKNREKERLIQMEGYEERREKERESDGLKRPTRPPPHWHHHDGQTNGKKRRRKERLR